MWASWRGWGIRNPEAQLQISSTTWGIADQQLSLHGVHQQIDGGQADAAATGAGRGAAADKPLKNLSPLPLRDAGAFIADVQ